MATFLAVVSSYEAILFMHIVKNYILFEIPMLLKAGRVLLLLVLIEVLICLLTGRNVTLLKKN